MLMCMFVQLVIDLKSRIYDFPYLTDIWSRVAQTVQTTEEIFLLLVGYLLSFLQIVLLLSLSWDNERIYACLVTMRLEKNRQWFAIYEVLGNFS